MESFKDNLDDGIFTGKKNDITSNCKQSDTGFVYRGLMNWEKRSPDESIYHPSLIRMKSKHLAPTDIDVLLQVGL